MPSLAVTGVAWTISSYIIYLFLSTYLKSRRNASKARELRCEEPPHRKNLWPFGLDNLKRSLDADKKKLFPDEMIQKMRDVGAITFKYSILGMSQISTADEKNIQAMLANQFADFGTYLTPSPKFHFYSSNIEPNTDLGPIRRDNFFPLLGNGIFTQDGKAWEHSRAMMRPQFAREQVSDLDLEERHVQNMMSAIDASTHPNGWTDTLDLQVLFFRLTLDSACEFLFGQSVDSQITLALGAKKLEKSAGNGVANSLEFATAFDISQNALAVSFSSVFELASF